MKKLITLITIMTFAITTWAANRNSSILHLVNSERKNFTLLMDGEVYRSEDFSVLIINLKPGKHKIEIFENNYFDAGRKQSEKYHADFRSFLFLEPNLQYDYILDLNDRMQLAQVFELNMHHADFPQNFDEHCENEYEDFTWNQNFIPAAPVCTIMNPNDFSILMKSIDNAIFDDEKVMQFTAATKYNMMNVAQVSAVLGLLSFEDNKMEVAKHAFNKVCDKQNFYRLTDAFTYSSSKQELLNFINTNS